MSNPRTVGQLCSRDVVTVGRPTPVREAARRMREWHVGCIVVTDEGPEGRWPVGVLTDRDLVTAAMVTQPDPLQLESGTVMSDDLVTVHEDATPRHALTLMRHRRIRRLPVVDSSGLLVGLLSIDDLLLPLAEELRWLADVVAGQRQVESMRRP
jgi:CBS domain-containing protein